MKQNEYFDDKKLKSLLANMPKLQDNQEMDELYNKVVDRLDDSVEIGKKNRRSWLLPTLATAAVGFIGVIYSSIYLNQESTSEIADMGVENHSRIEEKVEINEEQGFTIAENAPPLDQAEMNGINGNEKGMESFPENQSQTMQKIINDNNFFGLKLGMNAQDIEVVLGGALYREERNDIYKFFYQEEHYGLQIKLDLDDGSITEYNFYPEFLPIKNNKNEAELFQLIPTNKSEVEALFGNAYTLNESTCDNGDVCQEYQYVLDGNRILTVKFKGNSELVENIQYVTTKYS